jgi:phosphonate transport system substrate-binding protein
MKRRTILASALAAAVLPSCGGKKDSADAVLSFSAIPDQNKTELKEKFDKMADYLSKELGIKVEYKPASDYKASVEAFAQGDVQLAWFGGLTGVQARDRVDGAHAIAQGKADPEYFSYFIAHKDSGLEKSDDFPEGIAGKSFTFGSESSTSGRLMPEFFIRDNTGKSPAEFLGAEPGFSGSHDATAKAVESGKIMVGALSYKAYDNLVAKGDIDPEICKVIWKTPFYADYNWTAHPELEEKFGEGFTGKLRKVLLTMPTELLEVFPRDGMIEAKDSDFQGIVDVAKALGFVK